MNDGQKMTFEISFESIQKIVHQNAIEKGWWDEDRNDAEQISLMHSELSLASCHAHLALVGSRTWELKDISADYVAGLFDGEGHAGVCKTVRKPNGRLQYLTRVQIAMADKEPICGLDYFGAKIKETNPSRWNENATDKMYCWTIHGHQSEEFILRFLPKLKNLRKIASCKLLLMMEFLRKRPGGNKIDPIREPMQESLYRAVLNINSRKEKFKQIKDEHLVISRDVIFDAIGYYPAGNPPDDKIPRFSGVEAELADVIIRIMDFAEGGGHDVAGSIVEKIKFNKTRPHKHGKLF